MPIQTPQENPTIRLFLDSDVHELMVTDDGLKKIGLMDKLVAVISSFWKGDAAYAAMKPEAVFQKVLGAYSENPSNLSPGAAIHLEGKLKQNYRKEVIDKAMVRVTMHNNNSLEALSRELNKLTSDATLLGDKTTELPPKMKQRLESLKKQLKEAIVLYQFKQRVVEGNELGKADSVELQLIKSCAQKIKALEY